MEKLVSWWRNRKHCEPSKTFLELAGNRSGQSSPQPGTSRSTRDAEETQGPSLSHILTAPDLQLDCLSEEEDEDEESDEESEVVYTRTQYEPGVSDTALADLRIANRRRSLPPDTPDYVPPRKIRRVNTGHPDFGQGATPSSMYLPHASLFRAQQLRRELQRRTLTFNGGSGEEQDAEDLQIPIPVNHRMVLASRVMGIESRLNRMLQLIGKFRYPLVWMSSANFQGNPFRRARAEHGTESGVDRAAHNSVKVFGCGRGGEGRGPGKVHNLSRQLRGGH